MADLGSMCYATKINAGNDNNGNPRRGWLVYAPTGRYLGFADEGYNGTYALQRFAESKGYAAANELATIPTTPGFYRECKRA